MTRWANDSPMIKTDVTPGSKMKIGKTGEWGSHQREPSWLTVFPWSGFEDGPTIINELTVNGLARCRVGQTRAAANNRMLHGFPPKKVPASRSTSWCAAEPPWPTSAPFFSTGSLSLAKSLSHHFDTTRAPAGWTAIIILWEVCFGDGDRAPSTLWPCELILTDAP